jgi:hypothetical protein
MRQLRDKLIAVLSSLGLSCTLLILLGLLTWLGTLEQTRSGLYEVQRKYFESFVLLHDLGPISLPLPGANLVLSLLALNLIVGGVVRLRKSPSTYGILIVHLGILLMLAAGFVKWRFSNDGQITLYEGQRAEHFNDLYRYELTIVEHCESGELLEFRVPQEWLVAPSGQPTARLASEHLPFQLDVEHFSRNTRVMKKGPMFAVQVPVIDGLFLREEPLDPQAERNIAGAYLQVVAGAGETPQQGIVWGAQAAPWTVVCAGRNFSLDMRRERHELNFALRLDDFQKVDHPGTAMPASFTSDVTLSESGSDRALRISMNEPLRSQGLVVYQASWGPQGAVPGARLFSTFAVVRNPADNWPLYSCIVIAAGLMLHFGRKLRGALRAKAAV